MSTVPSLICSAWSPCTPSSPAARVRAPPAMLTTPSEPMRVVGRVDEQLAAADHHRDRAGDALGGGVVGDRGVVPAARDDAHRAVGEDHVGLRGDAVVPGGDVDGTARDLDVPEGLVLVVVGLQAVAAGRDVERAAGDHQVVLAADPVVDRVDRDRAAGDDEAVLGGDPVVRVAVDRQRAVAGDREVGAAEQGRARPRRCRRSAVVSDRMFSPSRWTTTWSASRTWSGDVVDAGRWRRRRGSGGRRRRRWCSRRPSRRRGCRSAGRCRRR